MPWREGVGKPFVMPSSEIPVEDRRIANDDPEIISIRSCDEASEFDMVVQPSEPSILQFVDHLEKSEPGDDGYPWDRNTPSLPPAESLPNESGPQAELLDTSRGSFFANLHQDSSSFSDALQPANVFNNIVANAVVSQASINIPSMPWETGPMKAIFCETDLGDMNLNVPLENAFREDLLPSEPVADFPEIVGEAASNLVPERSLSSQAIANLADKDFHTRQIELRNLAVDKWLCIVRSYTLSSHVGQLILSQCNLNQIDEAREIVSSVIGTRSSTTAIGRANAVLKYLRWANERDEVLDPQAETTAWEYVKFLKSSGAAATVGSTWISSIRYAVFVFGYKLMQPIVDSRRVVGQCDVMYVDKDTLNQADPFTVSQVKEMHRMLDSDCMDSYDKAFVAFLLTAIYSRSRHSDLRLIHRVINDVDDRGGFVEMQTKYHKCAKSTRKKTMLLPLLAPARGVDGSVWPPKVAAALADVGLCFDGFLDQPLLRAIDSCGNLCRRGVTSTETNDFIKLLFPGTSLSSHSCKSTALSWAAKYGLSLPDRNILGRHSDATRDTSAVYSRDLGVAAVRKLQGMIDSIAEGTFAPDESRRGYFPSLVVDIDSPVQKELQPTKIETIEVKEDQEATIDIISDDDGSHGAENDFHDTESSSDEVSSSDVEVDTSLKRPRLIKISTSIKESHGLAYRHQLSKLVHYVVASAGSTLNHQLVFSCGRKLSSKYEKADSFDPFNMCSLCKKHAATDGALKD